MQSPPEIVKKAKFDEPTEGGNNDWTDGRMDRRTDSLVCFPTSSNIITTLYINKMAQIKEENVIIFW